MEVGAKFPNNGLQELLMSVLLSENPQKMERESSYTRPRNKPTKKIPQLPPSPRKKGRQLQAFKGEEKKSDQKKPRGLVKKSPRTPGWVTLSK